MSSRRPAVPSSRVRFVEEKQAAVPRTALLEITEGDLHVVLCPKCGGSNLHFDGVEMHSAGGQAVTLFADGEDENATISVTYKKSLTKSRRHAIVLLYQCETCPGYAYTPEFEQIILEQNEGSTFARTTGAN